MQNGNYMTVCDFMMKMMIIMMMLMMMLMMMIVILPCVHFRKEIKLCESSAQIWTNMNENCKTKKRIE